MLECRVLEGFGGHGWESIGEHVILVVDGRFTAVGVYFAVAHFCLNYRGARHDIGGLEQYMHGISFGLSDDNFKLF